VRLILEIEPGSVAPRSVAIEAHSESRVGRMAPAQVILNDQTVSRQHFAISFNGRIGRLRDLGSTHGTSVNGKPVNECVLYDGDLIEAGVTTLRVRIADEATEGETITEVADGFATAPISALETAESSVIVPTLHDSLMQTLSAQGTPLYAILDAARDPLILAWLLDCKEEHQSLYEGTKGDQLAAFAPYLVALPRGSAFLEKVVRCGWGKSWGVYLTCNQTFKDVRKHLRHFLMVELDGEQVYFRFYDPRVLRVFLPTCTPQEVVQFFGPIRQYFFEGFEQLEMQIGSVERSRLRVERRPLESREVRQRPDRTAVELTQLRGTARA
jgi:Domain of unknown function (DUF4123)/FHA domain